VPLPIGSIATPSSRDRRTVTSDIAGAANLFGAGARQSTPAINQTDEDASDAAGSKSAGTSATSRQTPRQTTTDTSGTGTATTLSRQASGVLSFLGTFVAQLIGQLGDQTSSTSQTRPSQAATAYETTSSRAEAQSSGDVFLPGMHSALTSGRLLDLMV
jgi:hypothetical protein